MESNKYLESARLRRHPFSGLTLLVPLPALFTYCIYLVLVILQTQKHSRYSFLYNYTFFLETGHPPATPSHFN